MITQCLCFSATIYDDLFYKDPVIVGELKDADKSAAELSDLENNLNLTCAFALFSRVKHAIRGEISKRTPSGRCKIIISIFNDDVSTVFAWCHKLLIHRLHITLILSDNLLHGSAALTDVALFNWNVGQVFIIII